MPHIEQLGIHPSQICENLDDHHIAQLLPSGAFDLITTLNPELVNGSNRAGILGALLSLELAVDDPARLGILLSTIPEFKISELENRIGLSIDELQQKSKLEPPVRRELLGFFGLNTTSYKPSANYIATNTVQPDRGLFPHQKRAASAVEQYLYSEESRTMLHLPTGVGKTRTAMSIVASHLRARSTGLVLWLANSPELLEQAASEFEATWRVVGDRQVDCVRCWSHYNPPIDEISDGIVIAGLAKLHSLGKERERLWNLGDRTTLIVFDEAHQAVATTYQDIVETIVTRNLRTPLLGLSATPGRTWDNPEEDARVAEIFNENKVMIDFGDDNPITRLTSEGYLASVDFSLLNVNPGLDLSPEDIADISISIDIPDSLVDRLGGDQQRNLRIVQRILELAKEHSRILVFAVSVDNAILLAGVCRGLGLKADSITSKTDKFQREHVIRRFKARGGPHRILVNFGILTTGFDVPAASAALIARPTKSLVLYSQMVGRVIRGPQAGGTKSCKVITVVDTNLPGFRGVPEAFMNWEDSWNKS